LAQEKAKLFAFPACCIVASLARLRAQRRAI